MKQDDDWILAALRNNWQMPTCSWWLRLPPFRQLRASRAYHSAARHARFMSRCGFVSTGYDEWVIYGIWRGFQRDVPFPPIEGRPA